MENLLNRQIRVSLGTSKSFTKFVASTIPFTEIASIAADPNKSYSFSWYKNDYRLLKNIIPGTDVIAFDFDNCPKVYNIIKEKLGKYYGFIMPTKSYMKDKGGITVPRYRVFLLLKETIFLEPLNYTRAYLNMLLDLKLYCKDCCEEQCEYTKGCSCDIAVRDASRLFYGASIDNTLIEKLDCKEFLDFQKFDYTKPETIGFTQKFIKEYIDIQKYKHLDLSFLDNIETSKRYECPICAMNGDDPNKHHLGVSSDGKFVTCFYDNDHSVILRKLKKLDMSEISTEKKKTGKIAATPDLIPIGHYNPKPTNCNLDKVRQTFDRHLEYLSKHNNLISLDIETYPNEYLLWTQDQAVANLEKEYKYIQGAWTKANESIESNALDCYKANVRIFSIACVNSLNMNDITSMLFDTAIMTDVQLEKLLYFIRTAGMVILQNGKYDLLTLSYRYGIENVLPKYVFDTMLAAKIHQSSIDVEPSPAGNKLGQLLRRYCNIIIDKDVEHTWGLDNLTPVQLHYAIRDTKYLPILMNAEILAIQKSFGPFNFKDHDKKELEFLGPLLNIHPTLAIEMQFLLELVRIEYNGVRTNHAFLKQKADEFYTEYNKEQDRIGVNLNSPLQLKKWMQLNIDPNIESTSAKALGSTYDNDPNYKKIMSARKKYKVATLLDAMSKPREDGKLHPEFNQLISTGRQSCSNPNMQQIPREFKHSVYDTIGSEILDNPEKLEEYKQEYLKAKQAVIDAQKELDELLNL